MRSSTLVSVTVFALLALPQLGCSAAATSDGFSPSEDDQAIADALTIARPIEFGAIEIATFGCAPTCRHEGTTSEGWYDGCAGYPIKMGKCQDDAAICDKQGSKSEGWYTVGGQFLRWDNCSHKTAREPYEAYTFQGKKGQQVDIRVDGLLQRADGSLKGIDTRVRLFKRNGVQIRMNDDSPESPWTLRLNEAPNPRSSSLLGYQLPSDDLYILLVDAKQEQGSAEVVVKTPNMPLCAVAVVAPPDAPTYNYVGNFTLMSDADTWLASFNNVVSTEVEQQACNEPRVCPAVAKPVCGIVLHDEPTMFGNSCEFLAAVSERAGDDGESKGYYYDGECPTAWCATVTTDTGTFYAQNFSEMTRAEDWQAGFPDRIETTLDPKPCNEPAVCNKLYEPVCGTVFTEAPVSYSNECEFKTEVKMRAGSDSFAKGYWTAGYCQAPADPAFCTSSEDCTATIYGQRVQSADDCYCPMCPSHVVNLAESTARSEGWQAYCSTMNCPLPKCAQPPHTACVNNTCQFDFGNY